MPSYNKYLNDNLSEFLFGNKQKAMQEGVLTLKTKFLGDIHELRNSFSEVWWDRKVRSKQLRQISNYLKKND